MEYSVIIRTLGTAGQKYANLLKCIENLKPLPKEVIVVLPEGYELPKERLTGGLAETFCFSKKGMVTQRVYGMRMCKTPYMLVCDDDIEFDSEFVNKLYTPVSNGLCDFSAGPLFDFLPDKGIKSLYNTVSSLAAATMFNKDKYVKVLRSSGWSYNRNIDTKGENYYMTESAAGGCFFASKKGADALNFEDEAWVEKNGYGSLDDQAMFYKATCKGLKTIIVSNAFYKHMDGQTSVVGIRENVLFSSGFNRYVFWHRFIYTRERTLFMKLVDIICFYYLVFFKKAFSFIKGFSDIKERQRQKIWNTGFKAAKRFVKTQDYTNLPKV